MVAGEGEHMDARNRDIIRVEAQQRHIEQQNKTFRQMRWTLASARSTANRRFCYVRLHAQNAKKALQWMVLEKDNLQKVREFMVNRIKELGIATQSEPDSAVMCLAQPMRILLLFCTPGLCDGAWRAGVATLYRLRQLPKKRQNLSGCVVWIEGCDSWCDLISNKKPK